MKNNINTQNYIEEEYIDKYWIFKWFIDRDKHSLELLIYRLYDEKRYIWLSEFYIETITVEEYEKIKDDDEKQIEITLDYITPLIKEWKLKARIVKYIRKDEFNFESNGYSEYNKNNVDDFVKDLKEKYFSIDSEKEKNVFIEHCVIFTLVENEWPKELV